MLVFIFVDFNNSKTIIFTFFFHSGNNNKVSHKNKERILFFNMLLNRFYLPICRPELDHVQKLLSAHVKILKLSRIHILLPIIKLPLTGHRR